MHTVPHTLPLLYALSSLSSPQYGSTASTTSYSKAFVFSRAGDDSSSHAAEPITDGANKTAKSRWAGMARTVSSAAAFRTPLNAVNSSGASAVAKGPEKSFLAKVIGGSKNWAKAGT